jgi:hypothetical protein
VGSNPGWQYNAIGFDGPPYNPSGPDVIYAVSQTSSTNPTEFPAGHLLVIGSDGTVHDLGAITFPVGTAAASADGINFGGFDSSGNYWIGSAGGSNGGNGVLYEVNLTTLVATAAPGAAGAGGGIQTNDITFDDVFSGVSRTSPRSCSGSVRRRGRSPTSR